MGRMGRTAAERLITPTKQNSCILGITTFPITLPLLTMPSTQIVQYIWEAAWPLIETLNSLYFICNIRFSLIPCPEYAMFLVAFCLFVKTSHRGAKPFDHMKMFLTYMFIFIQIKLIFI